MVNMYNGVVATYVDFVKTGSLLNNSNRKKQV